MKNMIKLNNISSKFVGGTVAVVSTLALSSISNNNTVELHESSKYLSNDDGKNESVEEIKEEKISICDGTVITSDCEVDGIVYSLYVYHPAESEKTHVETETTYTDEIVGYCTLCNDGTRSPSCSTGRGTCSHHGGVAEWNAPIYRKVPHYEQKVIVDSPAVSEYYEKVIK